MKLSEVLKNACLLVVLMAGCLYADIADEHSKQGMKAPHSKHKNIQIGVKKRISADLCKTKTKKGDSLSMHYTGTLEDGSEFDSSIPRGQPFVFTLGAGQVIKGWDQGLLGMCEGEKRKLVIPPEFGYGDRGAPPKIPGGAYLTFEVELLKIERKGGEL